MNVGNFIGLGIKAIGDGIAATASAIAATASSQSDGFVKGIKGVNLSKRRKPSIIKPVARRT